MGLEIRRGTERRIMAHSDGFTIQVEVEDTLSQEGAEMALERLRSDLVELADVDQHDNDLDSEAPSPNYVSDVVRLPGSPFIYVDAHQMPKRALGELPNVLRQQLHELGVHDAIICVPKFDERNIAARSRFVRDALAVAAFPSPERLLDLNPLPSGWVDIAYDWLLRGDSCRTIDVVLASVTMSVPTKVAEILLRQVAVSAGITLARIEGPTVRLVQFQNVGRLVLAVGTNPGSEEPRKIQEEFVLLLTFLDRLAAEGMYGFLTVEKDLSSLESNVHIPMKLNEDPMPRHPEAVARHSDIMLFDAFPAQIIGPGHIELLPDVDPQWRRRISASREVLTFPTEPTGWLPGSPVSMDLLRRYRQLLAPCLVL